MAYAESTIGGTYGGSFRVWVNSIRTRNGTAGENFEEWRAEGGVKRISTSGGRIWNNYNAATFNVQLGMNGVGNSGRFNYDYGGGTGNMNSWGTGTTRVHRNSAGVGFGFTSRMDVNLANGSYLTSGWVTASDSVQTKYRSATLTALSMDAGKVQATDEGPIWLEFSNPGGAAVKGFIEINGARRYTSGNTGSRFNFPNLSGGSLSTILQQQSANSNSKGFRIGIHSSIGGHDTWDFRDRTYYIKNNNGQANPTYSNFTYVDENPATVAVTGNNQILIQGKSDLKVTVPVANKATAKKHATMKNYLFSIGGYSKTSPWSNTTNVVQDIGTVSDVSGKQSLTVRAIDSRGNGKTVSKTVTVLPYFSPGFYNNLRVDYANDFDLGDGLVVNLFNNDVIGTIAPMTVGGTDKNAVTPTTGIRYDIRKGEGAFTGTWTNVPFTQEAETGQIKVNPVTLADSIESRMNALGADNTVRWHILFQIQDKLETQYYTVSIDVGRPFFRIGADGRLYYKEIEFFETFSGRSDRYYPSVQAYGSTGSNWTRVGAGGYIGGWSILTNSNKPLGGTGGGSNGDTWAMSVYIPAGVYSFVFYLWGGPGGAKVDITISSYYPIITGFDTYNSGGYTDKIAVSDTINVLDGATYTFTGKANGRHTSNTTDYINGIIGIKAQRVGNL